MTGRCLILYILNKAHITFWEGRVNDMVFIFLAFGLLIVGEIFLILLYLNGGKQFLKCNKENSKLSFSTLEDFVSSIKSIPGIEVHNVDDANNKVELVYKRQKYVMLFENDKAFIEYDTAGCGARVSVIGRTFKMLAFCKAVKKAYIINNVFGIDSDKDFTKFKVCKAGMFGSVVAMLICAVVGVVSLLSGVKDGAINNVKESVYRDDMTYGYIIEGYIKDPEWKAFNNDNGVAVVEVNGTSVEKQSICIQFMGEGGMGFNDVDTQEFKLYYFGVDGKSVEPESSMAYIAEMVEEDYVSWFGNEDDDETEEEREENTVEPTVEPTQEPTLETTPSPSPTEEPTKESEEEIDLYKGLYYAGYYEGSKWGISVNMYSSDIESIYDPVGYVEIYDSVGNYDSRSALYLAEESEREEFGTFDVLYTFSDQGPICYIGFNVTDFGIEAKYFSLRSTIDYMYLRIPYVS